MRSRKRTWLAVIVLGAAGAAAAEPARYELEATLNKSAPYPIGDRAEVMGVSARGTLLRSEFGMTYGVADNLVGDEVEIVIEIEARRGDERQPR